MGLLSRPKLWPRDIRKVGAQTLLGPTQLIFCLFFSPSELGTWKPEEEKGECGTDLIGSSIVGGVNAKAGEFPYMALLGAKKRYNGEDIVQFLCGGSVINKWYILTAAHCIKAGKRVSLHINNM